jgi:hypothetical protein
MRAYMRRWHEPSLVAGPDRGGGSAPLEVSGSETVVRLQEMTRRASDAAVCWRGSGLLRFPLQRSSGELGAATLMRRPDSAHEYDDFEQWCSANNSGSSRWSVARRRGWCMRRLPLAALVAACVVHECMSTWCRECKWSVRIQRIS